MKMSCPQVMSSADKLSFQVRQGYLKAYYVKQVVTQLVLTSRSDIFSGFEVQGM